MPDRSLKNWRGILLGTLLLMQVGCAGRSLIDWSGNSFPKADEKNPVRKMVCIWEPVEGQGLDGLPTRGFAGQIMFFTHNSPSPVMSDGDVRVYLYDDRGTREERARPIHQFDFDGQAWNTHLQKSTPGPSYRIFIPYTGQHPWQANCGLRVRLTTPRGHTVYSEMVNVCLPGPVGKQAEETKAGTAAPAESMPAKARVMEFQLGASLNRRTAPATGTPAAVSKLERSDILQRALGASQAEHLVPANSSRGSAPVRLSSAQSRSQPLEAQSVTSAEQARIRQLEQRLHELKQKQQLQAPQTVHPLGGTPAAAESSPAPRFRLTPATSGASSRRMPAHPLAGQSASEHPLEGL